MFVQRALHGEILDVGGYPELGLFGNRFEVCDQGAPEPCASMVGMYEQDGDHRSVEEGMIEDAERERAIVEPGHEAVAGLNSSVRYDLPLVKGRQCRQIIERCLAYEKHGADCTLDAMDGSVIFRQKRSKDELLEPSRFR